MKNIAKVKINLVYYKKYMNQIDIFLKEIKAKIKVGRIYLNLEYKRENISRFMERNNVFMGGGASDQRTGDLDWLIRCLEKVLKLENDSILLGDEIVV